MKVLYIGHYKEFGGWAEAAKSYILALDSVGVDVVCRNVTLTGDREISGRLKELEEKDTNGCDICIQHVLPHHLCGSGKFKKNIAFLATETVSIKHLPWFNYLQQMDSVWVPNDTSKKYLESDNLGIPVSVVPHTFDTSKYKKRYPSLDMPAAEDQFVFYYIGDLNDRKNLESIITCFHSEFDPSENTRLLLKVNKFGKSPEEVQKIVDDKCSQVKQKLRLYKNLGKYKPEIIVPSMVENDMLLALHQQLNCFICPSHGEAWSIPSFDAMALGSRPICSNFGGPPQFITEDEKTGFCVDGSFSCCKCSDAAFPDLFTSREYWFNPCEMQIRQQMRKYFEEYKENPIKYDLESKSAGLKRAEEFSYAAIGQLMKEILNG
jgi:glycosyltransferase involved in cell wall biosynthesis